MEQDISQSPIAVYLHIPFCLRRCNYCTFYSTPYSRTGLEEYAGQLLREIRLYQSYRPELSQADTIYFGGGTPSLLSPAQINAITALFRFSPSAEISLEINPQQITEAYLKELAVTPVNRISLGLQSMLDAELDWLSRRHRSAQTRDRIRLLKDHGYTNISLDLIYGLPGAGLDVLKYNLDRYLELEPAHISTYLLDRERLDPGRRPPVYAQTETSAIPEPDEDELQARSYELIRKTLMDNGFEHYEISNFARPGLESRHNLHYWQSDDYLGLGASASGFLEQTRYTNPADLRLWAQNVDRGRIMPDPETGVNAANDYLMMGLRLSVGISLSEYSLLFGRDLAIAKAETLEKLKRAGLIRIADARLSLSPEALFISNYVIGELLE